MHQYTGEKAVISEADISNIDTMLINEYSATGKKRMYAFVFVVMRPNKVVTWPQWRVKILIITVSLAPALLRQDYTGNLSIFSPYTSFVFSVGYQQMVEETLQEYKI